MCQYHKRHRLALQVPTAVDAHPKQVGSSVAIPCLAKACLSKHRVCHQGSLSWYDIAMGLEMVAGLEQTSVWEFVGWHQVIVRRRIGDTIHDFCSEGLLGVGCNKAFLLWGRALFRLRWQ